MPENTFKVALAGLLHDIGSFARRAAKDSPGQTDQDIIEELVPAHYRPQKLPDQNVRLAARLAAGGNLWRPAISPGNCCPSFVSLS